MEKRDLTFSPSSEYGFGYARSNYAEHDWLMYQFSPAFDSYACVNNFPTEREARRACNKANCSALASYYAALALSS